jgi:hypothetical protein
VKQEVTLKGHRCSTAGLAVAACFLTTSALAQGAGYSLQSTAISVSDLLAPWLPILMTAFMGVVLAVLELIRQKVAKRTGVLVETSHMQALQKAIENAAGVALSKLSTSTKTLTVDTGNPAVRHGVIYVNAAAADAVKAFNLTPEQIAEKVIAQMSVITAPNPEVSIRDVTPPPPDPGKGG